MKYSSDDHTIVLHAIIDGMWELRDQRFANVSLCNRISQRIVRDFLKHFVNALNELRSQPFPLTLIPRGSLVEFGIGGWGGR